VGKLVEWPVRKFISLKEQRGISLIETLIALGILALIGVAFISSLTTAYNSVDLYDEQTQAEALIRTQLEDIRDSPYADSCVYPTTVELPPQYSISINVTALDTPTCTADGNCNTLQEIKVIVYRPAGDGDKAILSISTYKAKE